MPLSEDFPVILRSYSNTKICEMLANFEDYEPEAIHLARAEAQRRAIPSSDIASAKRVVVQSRSLKKKVEDEKLSPWIKLLALTGVFPALPFLAYYEIKNKTRKKKELFSWSFFAFCMWVFILILLPALLREYKDRSKEPSNEITERQSPR